MELLQETIKAALVVPAHPTAYPVLPYTTGEAGLVMAKGGQIHPYQGELIKVQTVLLIQAQEEAAMEHLQV